MTAPHIVDPERLLGEALSQASPDLMRSLLQTVINSLLSAELMRCAVPSTVRPAPSAGFSAMAIGTGDLDRPRVGTIDVACSQAAYWLRTSPTGCSSAVNGPSPR